MLTHTNFLSHDPIWYIYIDFLNSRQSTEPQRKFELRVRLHISTFTGPHISTTKSTRGREITAGWEIRSLVSVHNQYCLAHILKLRLGPSGALNCYHCYCWTQQPTVNENSYGAPVMILHSRERDGCEKGTSIRNRGKVRLSQGEMRHCVWILLTRTTQTRMNLHAG